MITPMEPKQRTALFSVIAAGALVVIKLVTGIATGSLGLVADAIHSGTDLVAALLTLFAVRVAVRPPDPEHPFGHRKAEHLTALAEGAFLLAASAFIVIQAVGRLGEGAEAGVDAAWYALAVLGIVIVVDASRALISSRASRRYGSPALAANALHFASDLLSSAAVLIGLILVRAGYPEADAVAALLVAGLVVLAAGRLMRENVNVLMDRAPAGATTRARQAVEHAVPTAEIRRLRVREAAGTHFVDVIVAVRPDAAVGQGHAVADEVETAIREALGGGDVVVHVEPRAGSGALRERATAAALGVREVREVHNVRVATVEGDAELSLHIKLPHDLVLERAHEIASEVEAAIRDQVPELSDVHTHIEPLAAPRTAHSAGAEEMRSLEHTVREIVRRVTGTEPPTVRVRREPSGLVVLLTVTTAADDTLQDAHALAGEVKRRIRAELPAPTEVIVHTEPFNTSSGG